MTNNRATNRLPQGGMIDRTKPIRFDFDGKSYDGYAGDTLASALLANGVDLIGRSFKYHRPRGVFAAGSEEPNALVTVGSGDAARPNLRATEVPLVDGLTAKSQNRWPNLRQDLGALAGLFGGMLGAGFYYKTFLWPKGGWKFYERFIRNAAGLGRAPTDTDTTHYAHRHVRCDVLVIGAGPAGLSAAITANRAGAKVILCDERTEPGGSLIYSSATLDRQSPIAWKQEVIAELNQAASATLLFHSTCFAIMDGDLALIEDRRHEPDRQLWRVRPGHIILATGAVERPVPFPGNDRPGVMLTSSVQRYIQEYGVRPGQRAVIITNNDSAYNALLSLQDSDIETVAIIDLRSEIPDVARHQAGNTPIHVGSFVEKTNGQRRITGVTIKTSDDGTKQISCDLICISGGWTPNLQLFSQRGGQLSFDDDLGAHLPVDSLPTMSVTGAAAGDLTLEACLTSGAKAGLSAARSDGTVSPPTVEVECDELSGAKGATRPAPKQILNRKQKAFVDLQNDVTADDIAAALAEGFVSVEHVKRYTTVGMGTDQGKTSNINAISLIGDLTEKTSHEIGHTTFRPPASPVSLGMIVGPARDQHLAPTRRTPFHNVSKAAGCVFIESGSWLYPRYYPKPGETMETAIEREVLNTRENVGVVDMSTLGKIDVQGDDAIEFLERVYCNNLSSLQIGRVRYSLMLREDGIVLDDGTVSRLGENHYALTATTARAGQVWVHLEQLRQAHWPELDVKLSSVTDHWANLAVAGPKARALLAAVSSGLDLSPDAFPISSVRDAIVADCPARIFRVSFSGELGYEINVPAGYAPKLWDSLRGAGQQFGLMPYGLEALDIMRIEKGHISVGTEIDGRATPADLGLGRMVSKKKDFLGRTLLSRPALSGSGRRQLVGIRPVDRRTTLPIGCQITARCWNGSPQAPIGHTTAAIRSPTLGQPIGLAMVEDGLDRFAEELWAASPVAGRSVEVEICPPHFYDPDGSRMRV